MINLETLREALLYDPETGVFTWKHRAGEHLARWNTRWAGRKAGTEDTYGYIGIRIHNIKHLAHRLAWLYVTGDWPTAQLDHVNGDRKDNRFSNLRAVINAINCRNTKRSKFNKTGVTGVHLNKHGSYVALIGTEKGQRYLGSFAALSDAAAARRAAEKRHGYHPNHGRAG